MSLSFHHLQTRFLRVCGLQTRFLRVCGLQTRFLRVCGLQTRFLRCCGIVVVLALMALGSLQSAQASCGDWLVGHDMPAHSPDVTSGEADDTAAAKPAGTPKRRPCNGPSCGRAPVAPLAPSEAPTSSPDLERAALLSNLAPVEASTAGAWLALDEPLLIPAVFGPPERPPRVS